MTASPAPVTPEPHEPHEPVTLCDISEEMQKLDEHTLLFFQGFW